MGILIRKVIVRQLNRNVVGRGRVVETFGAGESESYIHTVIRKGGWIGVPKVT
jgi:hypothetical protein